VQSAQDGPTGHRRTRGTKQKARLIGSHCRQWLVPFCVARPTGSAEWDKPLPTAAAHQRPHAKGLECMRASGRALPCGSAAPPRGSRHPPDAIISGTFTEADCVWTTQLKVGSFLQAFFSEAFGKKMLLVRELPTLDPLPYLGSVQAVGLEGGVRSS
jgi:hypothetical protein